MLVGMNALCIIHLAVTNKQNSPTMWIDGRQGMKMKWNAIRSNSAWLTQVDGAGGGRDTRELFAAHDAAGAADTTMPAYTCAGCRSSSDAAKPHMPALGR